MRPVAEMAVAPAVAVGRGDGRGPERAAVIAALEGEHQALAVPGVAHELEAVLDRLAAADIEVDAALEAELALGGLGQHGGQLDLLAVQILARHLRQPVELAPRRLVEALVAVAEIDGRIPHLQVEVGPPLARRRGTSPRSSRRSWADRCSGRCRRASSTWPRARAARPPTAVRRRVLGARRHAASGRVSGLCILARSFIRDRPPPGACRCSAAAICFEPARQQLGRLREIGKCEVGQCPKPEHWSSSAPLASTRSARRRRRSPSGRRPRRSTARAEPSASGTCRCRPALGNRCAHAGRSSRQRSSPRH